MICNDLVAGFRDRYTQAKRHQYGSVTEFAWLATVLTDMNLCFSSWWALFTSETVRAGSFPSALGCLLAWCLEMGFSVHFTFYFSDLEPKAQLLIKLFGAFMTWQIVL